MSSAEMHLLCALTCSLCWQVPGAGPGSSGSACVRKNRTSLLKTVGMQETHISKRLYKNQVKPKSTYTAIHIINIYSHTYSFKQPISTTFAYHSPYILICNAYILKYHSSFMLSQYQIIVLPICESIYP